MLRSISSQDGRLISEIEPICLPAVLQRCIQETESAVAPAGPAAGAAAVMMVGEVLQVSLPLPAGLAVYYLPDDLLSQATIKVLKTHRFHTLPKPADWLEAVRDERHERAPRCHG